VNTPWTVESLAEAAGMSRTAFAARFKDLLGQTPLEYVTEWQMQKAMQLLQQRDKKLADVARSVDYESDAVFSKAFKRVVGPALVNTSNVVLKTGTSRLSVVIAQAAALQTPNVPSQTSFSDSKHPIPAETCAIRTSSEILPCVSPCTARL
jgi:hypothetical protein